MIGSFGSRLFRVSSRQVSTFDGFSRSVAVELENTAVDGSRPSTRIKGMKLGEISFSVTLDQRWGDVQAQADAWLKICESREPQFFVLGGAPVGHCKWLLTTVNIKDTVIDSEGRLRKAVLDMGFQEIASRGTAAAAKIKPSARQVTANPPGTVSDTPAVTGSSQFRTAYYDKRLNLNVVASVQNGPVSTAKKPTLYVLKKDQ